MQALRVQYETKRRLKILVSSVIATMDLTHALPPAFDVTRRVRAACNASCPTENCLPACLPGACLRVPAMPPCTSLYLRFLRLDLTYTTPSLNRDKPYYRTHFAPPLWRYTHRTDLPTCPYLTPADTTPALPASRARLHSLPALPACTTLLRALPAYLARNTFILFPSTPFACSCARLAFPKLALRRLRAAAAVGRLPRLSNSLSAGGELRPLPRTQLLRVYSPPYNCQPGTYSTSPHVPVQQGGHRISAPTYRRAYGDWTPRTWPLRSTTNNGGIAVVNL